MTDMQKYKLQKKKKKNIREIQITDIPKYKLQKTEIQITEIQKFK